MMEVRPAVLTAFKGAPAPVFPRAETWRAAGTFIDGVLAGLERSAGLDAVGAVGTAISFVPFP